MEKRKKGRSWLLTILMVLIAGVAAGYAVGRAGANNTGQTNNQASGAGPPDSGTKAAEFRALLNNLQTEHASLAAAAARAAFDASPDSAAAMAALDKNTNALADEFGKYYGPEARSRFYELWNGHAGYMMDYARAAKAADQAAMNRANQSQNGYVEAFADLLSRANENLPKDAVAQLAGEHVGHMKNIIDKYAAGDYAASYESERQARSHIAGLADTLAAAIVKQKPGNF